MTYDYTLTLGSSAVQLSTVLQGNTQATTTARWISLQGQADNTGEIYIGGNNHGSDTSSTSYGFALPIPVPNVSDRPFVIDFAPAQSLDLTQFWVKGTADDVLHIFVIF